MMTADANKDDELDRDEATRALEMLGFSQAGIEELYARFDIDNNGTFDRDEFEAVAVALHEEKAALGWREKLTRGTCKHLHAHHVVCSVGRAGVSRLACALKYTCDRVLITLEFRR